MSTRPHGTYARYKTDNCRCYPCAATVSAYNTARNRAIAYGRWQPYVDAQPVRDHIRALQKSGLGLRAIAAAAGVDRKRLQAILNGRPERGTPPQTKVRPAVASAITAVQPTLDAIPDGTVIDSIGTQRRLQALVAIGWSQAKLAARLGWAPSNFSNLIKHGTTTAATARRVRDLYDQLWNQAPPEQHHRDKIAASRARRHAAQQGWPPPGAWDDDTIDHADARPDMGAKVRRADALVEDSDWLLSQGFTLHQIADRLHVHYDTLTKARARHRREQVPA